MIGNPTEPQDGIECDDALMGRVGRGDRDAFETLYRRWSRRVMSYAYRSLSDKGEAEDVVQETFLSVFRAAPRYRPCERFGAYLFRIAGNSVRSRCRKKWPLPLDFPEEEDDSPPLDSGADWTLFEERERLESALATLPQPQREALLLAVTGGLSYREIALQEGVSEDAVAARICRARKALRKVLSISGCEEEETVDA
jgi:RNA polymerase sigma-70 factor (ECF subfamily)